jgi:hypothetical protein
MEKVTTVFQIQENKPLPSSLLRCPPKPDTPQKEKDDEKFRKNGLAGNRRNCHHDDCWFGYGTP